jgi:rhodanese-related sulfurtransferase
MLEGLVLDSDHKNLLIIDARSRRAFLKSHLPGAKHVDPFSSSFSPEFKKMPKSKSIIVYCRTFKRSEMVCNYLYESGFRKVIQIADGFTGWNQNKLPLEKV